MSKLAINRWEDPVNLLLGLWLLVSPLVLKYAAERSLMLSAIVLGASITVIAGAALYGVSAWQRVANMALGLCAIVDPWISETSHATATLNSVIIGWVLVALAVWTLASDPGELQEGRSHGHSTEARRRRAESEAHSYGREISARVRSARGRPPGAARIAGLPNGVMDRRASCGFSRSLHC